MKKMYYVLIALLVLLLAACGSDSSDSNDEGANEGNGDGQEEVSEDEGDDEEGESNLGTRSNPLPFGDTITVDESIYDDESESYDATVDFTLLEVIKGEEANQIVADENQFNDEPAEGYEYVLVKVKAEVTSAETEDYYLFLDEYDFKFNSDSGDVYDNTSVVIPDVFTGNAYNGGIVEGYFANQIEIADDFKVSYEPMFGSSVFFEVE
ncbi:hypothetical protein [Jeotgalibacillus marinus]|uniref:DUF4352 domain-containing protein n=1 Tax=Jeotgalibacillus marinus TaxID=86667 RepID=A0ABV3Q7L2_9BACL